MTRVCRTSVAYREAKRRISYRGWHRGYITCPSATVEIDDRVLSAWFSSTIRSHCAPRWAASEPLYWEYERGTGHAARCVRTLARCEVPR